MKNDRPGGVIQNLAQMRPGVGGWRELLLAGVLLVAASVSGSIDPAKPAQAQVMAKPPNGLSPIFRIEDGLIRRFDIR